jgi:hypothetical protein
MNVPELYYFGCWSDKGHHLNNVNGQIRPHTVGISNALGIALDTAFCPPDGTPEGQWQFSQVGPWLIMSCWDNAIDQRPGSHSTFIGRYCEGQIENHRDLMDRAKDLFPFVFNRNKKLL